MLSFCRGNLIISFYKPNLWQSIIACFQCILIRQRQCCLGSLSCYQPAVVSSYSLIVKCVSFSYNQPHHLVTLEQSSAVGGDFSVDSCVYEYNGTKVNLIIEPCNMLLKYPCIIRRLIIRSGIFPVKPYQSLFSQYLWISTKQGLTPTHHCLKAVLEKKLLHRSYCVPHLNHAIMRIICWRVNLFDLFFSLPNQPVG